MSTQTVQVKVPLKGLSKGERKVEIETAGFSGPACREATQALQGKLGMQSVEETEKAEMYEDPEQRQEFLSNGGD